MTCGFVNVVQNILTDCTFNKIDIGELPIYVVDFLYLMIHAKSTGEIIVSQYQCLKSIINPETNESTPCNTSFKVQFSLLDAFIKFPPDYNHKCIIQLNDSVGIRLKSPTFSKFRSIGLAGKDVFDITDDYIFSCVDCVFDGEKVLMPGTDFDIKELEEFIGQFPASKIDEVTNFFKAQPHVCLELNLTCPKCKNESVVELKGIKDFFD